MNLVDRVNRQRSLAAISRTRRFGRIAANASVPTTTYTYDANGNVIQVGGWNYVWDYLNRMLASGYNNSTTTYAYDPSGARVLQTSTTSTTYYPNKFYSLTSIKAGSNTYATSTNYIWNGDTLLATIDQPMFNGAATGTPITRYIHPDHLGSTNVVTDQNGNLVQLMDYYPYGATRIATSTYPTNEKRQYIGQFADAQTNLNYLNARYYDSARGQFVSQDPLFWSLKQRLANPQSLNPYSYAEDNPVTKEDPSGLDSKNSGSTNPQIQGLVQQIQTLLIQMLMLVASTAGGGGANVTTPAVSGNTPSSGGSPGLPTSGFGGVSSFGFVAGAQNRMPALVPGSGSPLNAGEFDNSVQWAIENKDLLRHLAPKAAKQTAIDLIKQTGGEEQFYKQLYSSVGEFPAPGSAPQMMTGTVNGTSVEFTGTRAVDGTFKLGTVYAIPTAGIAPAEVFQGFFIIPRDLLFYGGHGTQI